MIRLPFPPCLLVALALFAASPPGRAADPTLAPQMQKVPGGKTVKVVKCYPEGVMHAYCISFDDGILASDWPVLDALRKRKIPATFFINSLHPMSADAVKFPQRYEGFEVASHGAHHQGFDHLTLPEIREELTQDQQVLGDAFYCKVAGFAYPYGAVPKTEAGRKEADDLLRSLGFLYARGVKQTKLYVPPTDFMRWELDAGLFQDIDQYLALPTDEGVRSFMTFTHSGDFAKGLQPFDRGLQILDQVAQEPRLWKATMLDFTRYITALRALEISDRGIFNPSDLAVWVTINDQPVEIPAKKAIPWQQLPVS